MHTTSLWVHFMPAILFLHITVVSWLTALLFIHVGITKKNMPLAKRLYFWLGFLSSHIIVRRWLNKIATELDNRQQNR